MAAPWREEPEPVAKSGPTQERRLRNPALEQNLDKLAEAYFTGPPEQRERAVQGLLNELEAALTPEAAVPPKEQPVAQSGSLCPSCHRESRPGQRFCGYCGVPLYADVPPDYADSGGGILGLSPTFSDDMQFLREKTFGGVYAEEGTPVRWGVWIAAGLILLLAGLGYREWNTLGRPRSVAELMAIARPVAPVQRASVPPAAASAPASSTVQTPAPVPEAPAQTSPPPSQEIASSQVPASPPLPAPVKAAPAESTPPVSAQPSEDADAVQHQGTSKGNRNSGSIERTSGDRRTVTLASDTEKTVAPDNGAQELALAERYLDKRDPSVAARWLWKALGKQNGRAALLLADLYARGDGVSQSCDQARLLLMAAMKKGVTGAGARLQNLEASGCR